MMMVDWLIKTFQQPARGHNRGQKGVCMRYRLQRKESVSQPCIIGNRSYPLPTYRWKDIAVLDDLDALKANLRKDDNRRIIDTQDGDKIVW